MKPGLFRIITFASDVQHGNPAWVLVPESGALPEDGASISRSLDGEMVTVLRPGNNGEYAISFYLPDGPHPGAGHGVHAAAHHALAADGTAMFRRPDGSLLPTRRTGGRVAADWPVLGYTSTERGADLSRALMAKPLETYIADFGYVAVFGDEVDVAKLSPDLRLVSDLDRGALICTAPGTGSDIVIRVFAPKLNLPEDPVCGTAHRIIVPFWVGRLGKTQIHSKHLSSRGGDLHCELADGIVTIAGDAVTVVEESLQVGRV